MTANLQDLHISKLKNISKLASAITMLIGGAALVGWWFNFALLTSISPQFAPMRANSALSFLTGGLALWLLHSNSTALHWVTLRRACVVLVALIGILTLSEYLFHWNLGIDQLLVGDTARPDNPFPGRMAPITALNFSLLGIAFLLIDRPRQYYAAQLLAVIAGLFALFGLLGYLYGVESFYQIILFSSLPPETALTFPILCIGLLYAAPDQGWMAILINPGPGRVLSRRLVPAALIVPIVLGGLTLLGQNAGLYDAAFGLALFALLSIVIFSLLIFTSAVALYHIDIARQQAENDLRLLNAELDGRVLERTEQLTRVNQQLNNEVTERKQIESALRESEERYAILFRNSPAAITLTRLDDGHYLDVNESFLRLVGFDRAEVIGHTAVELGLVSRTDRAKNIQGLQERGLLRDFEASLKTKSGEPRLCLISAEQVEIGSDACSLSILYDITERKRVERESERLKNALDRMAEGAQIISYDWRYVYLNDSAALQGIRPKQELIGHTMPEMYPGIDQTPLFTVMQRCMTERTSEHFENQFTFPDNSVGWFDLSIQPIPEGIFILSTDISARKQADAALHKSEERFAKAFSSSPAALTITRLSDGFFIDANENFLNLFGYTRAEVIGRSYPDLSINTNPAEWAELMRQLGESGAVRNYEIMLQTKSGDPRNMLFSADTLELNGEAHVLTTLFDITLRKQAEAALRESEERFQLVAWATRDAIWDWDLKTDTIWWSDGLQKLFFYKSEEVNPDASWRAEHIHPEDRDKVLKSIQEILDRSDEFWSKEYRYRRSNGEYADVFDRAYILYDEQRKPKRMIGAMIDISERKQTEAALAQEHDLLQALLDNIPDTIYFKDAASRFTRINKAQARVLGINEVSQAVGKTDADFTFSPDLAASFYAEEQQLLQTRRPLIDRQEFNPTPDGQPRWFSATKVPMIDRHGRVSGLIGISRDITQRIKAEEDLQKANGQLTNRVAQMALLNELEEQLQACLAVTEVYQVTARLVSKLFPAEAGALYVINNSRNWVETGSAWGAMPPEALAFGLEDCWALRRGRTHLSGIDQANLPCHHLPSTPPPFSVCMPLLAQGDTLGILHLRAASASNRWDEAQEQLARVIADSVALALANLKLRETLRQQSIRDPLTELFNRRYMEESLEREILRAARTQRPVGIIMIDVDHFKQMNDSHGHDFGDAVLRQLGHFLKERTRGGDIACRYGGEEFTVILPEATLEQTRLRAEQHRQDFQAVPVHHNGQLLASPTLSLGVAAFPEHGAIGADLLKAADSALYRAKHEGRNRVIVSGA